MPNYKFRIQNWLHNQTGMPIVLFKYKNILLIRFGLVSSISLLFGLLLFIPLLVGLGISKKTVNSLLLYAPLNLILFSFVQSIILSFKSILKDYRFLKNISFGFFGGLLGVISTFIYFSYKDNFNLLALLDGSALLGGFIHGYARTACINYGCCHGKEIPNFTRDQLHILYTDPLSKAIRVSHYSQTPLYPVQLYESLGCIGIGIFQLTMILLFYIPGIFFSTYLVLYGLLRFICEFYRGEKDSPLFFNLSSYQWISLALFNLGIIFFFYFILKGTLSRFPFQAVEFNDIKEFLPYIIGMPLIMLFFYGFHYKAIGKWCS
ncbi:MAG: prolipoprotein diacylglyceryl transferase [Leptospiraceae bacterium]|nr:prolipoprotein diacylglyceryl transferase [Leptospiraceae bacterium]MCP5499201.1 prolipoprotein diacylglyceryl transferase [Leptospiraceae bacterium]